MTLPRLNVAQYAGNGIWDGNFQAFSSAIAALLGDPFEFAMAPEMHALFVALEGRVKTQRETLAKLERRWGQKSTNLLQSTFLDGASRLTRDYLMRHPVWGALDEDVRLNLEARLSTRAGLGREAAVCTAVLLADAAFATRSAADIWLVGTRSSSRTYMCMYMYGTLLRV